MSYRENSQLSTGAHPSIFLDIFQKSLALFARFFDLVFPKKCLSCKEEGFAFCAKCRGKIPLETSPFVSNTISVWQYDNPALQKALWQLKYREKQELAHDLAESLYDKLMEALAETELFENPAGNINEKYVLIPIPIHKNRQKERGYNQSELLAKELSLLDPSLFTLETGILKKTKETQSQVSVKNREQRLKNVHDSLSVYHPKKIIGKNIIVVDDVTTTGATLTEARKVLRKAGAKSVLCVTLAH
jgi:competence protein ComFC